VSIKLVPKGSESSAALSSGSQTSCYTVDLKFILILRGPKMARHGVGTNPWRNPGFANYPAAVAELRQRSAAEFSLAFN
jgi:hypothetical protein